MSKISSKEEVFVIVKKHIIDVLPDLSVRDIKLEDSLEDLGANSLDRMEIVIFCFESLAIKTSLIELDGINNLEGLVDFFFYKLSMYHQIEQSRHIE